MASHKTFVAFGMVVTGVALHCGSEASRVGPEVLAASPDGGKADANSNGTFPSAPEGSSRAEGGTHADAGDVPVVLDGGTCSSLIHAAPDVVTVGRGENLPAGLGGTVAPGRYFLTAFTYYAGAGQGTGLGGDTVSRTIYLTEDRFFMVHKNPGYPEEPERRTYHLSGAYFYWVSDCPEAHNSNPVYTATPTSFDLIYRDVNPKTGYVEHYERR